MKYIIHELETNPSFKKVNIKQMVKASANQLRVGEELKFRQPEVKNEQVKIEEDQNNDD